MKTFISSLLITLVSVICVAQWQQSNDPLMIKNREGISEPLNNLYPDLPAYFINEINPSIKNAAVCNWDTIITYDPLNRQLERQIQTFDINNDVVALTFQILSDEIWTDSKRYVYTYDKSGNLLTSTQQLWNNERYWWENISRSTCTYNAKGNVAMIYSEIWCFPHWLKNNRTTFIYHENGHIWRQVNEKFQNSQWVNNDRYLYTYDQNGRNQTCVYEKWHSDAWGSEWKITNAYDYAGNLNIWLYEVNQDGIWTKNYLELLTYNASGKVQTFIDLKWDKNKWEYLDRGFYYYKVAQGNLSSRLFEVWQNDKWVYNTNNTYYYNSENNLIMDVAQTWLKETWMYDWKKTYDYDGLGNSMAGKYEIWHNNAWQANGSPSDGLSVYSDNIPVYTIYNIYRYEASYALNVSNVTDAEISDDLLKLYPNPASDKITIEFTPLNTNEKIEISVLNLQGQLLIKKPIEEYKTVIDISALAKGIYFVKVEKIDVVTIAKFVKE